MTATSLFGSVSTSFARWDGEMFAHSWHENCSSSVKFDEDCRWTEIFQSHCKCSIGFKMSGLWLGQSRTLILFLFSHSSVAWALCFGSLSCWNVNLLPSFRFMADQSVHQVSSESINFLRYRAICHFGPISQWWRITLRIKKFSYLDLDSDLHQNANDSSLLHTQLVHQVSSESVHKFWDILLYICLTLSLNGEESLKIF